MTVNSLSKLSFFYTLYNSKGTRLKCNNHREIANLVVAGKPFARVVVPRLQKLAERMYPEFQWGFRFKHSTTDMTFSVRQLQVKCIEKNVPL